MTRNLRGRSVMGALAVGAVAAAAINLAPTAMAATTTPVHGYDIADWDGTAPMPTGWSVQYAGQAGSWLDYDDRTDTNGSFHMGVSDSTEKVWLRRTPASATTLSQVTAATYQSHVEQGTAVPAYQLGLDCNGAATTGGQVTLTWNTPAQAAGAAWVTNDTLATGSWTADRTINQDGSTDTPDKTPVGTGVQGGTAHPMADFTAVCGSGSVTSYGVTMGTTTATTNTATIDAVTFNTNVADFEWVGVYRIAGSDRIATSIAASKENFTAAGTSGAADSAVIASATAFADGLSGGPLAAAANGPLLLSGAAHVDSRVMTEIKRILPKGSTVYLVGGTGSLSATLASEVAKAGTTGAYYTVQRLSGADRFATAVAVANALQLQSVFLTDGENFPDALSAGPAAAHKAGAVLLTSKSTVPKATADYLKAHTSQTRYAVGGAAATAASAYVPTANRIVGKDRWETSTKVAQQIFPGTTDVAFASGLAFPDALSGGAYAAWWDEPIVLVPSSGALPSATASYLNGAKKNLDYAEVFGGTASVSDQFVGALESAINYGS